MKTPPKPTIAVCTSANFYRQAVDIEAQLASLGYNVVLPHSAYKMKRSGNFDVVQHRTWLTNPEDYPEKSRLMRLHFSEIDKADAILVLNYEKHDRTNYIGGNVLMEMTLAFFQKKPIFILNEAPDDSPFLEEILGMLPVFLHGKLEDLSLAYKKLRTAA